MQQDQKIDIQICLGSSCFSRGNKHLAKVIENYLNNNSLSHLVYYHGARCFSNCDRGPLVYIDGKEYLGLNEDRLIHILNDVFKKNITKV